MVVYENKKYHNVPYVKLWNDKIEFMFEDENIVYPFPEIKNVYVKDGDLYFEHTNFQKRFLLKNKGNQNMIPLSNLGNRQLFFGALEKVLGYSLFK